MSIFNNDMDGSVMDSLAKQALEDFKSMCSRRVYGENSFPGSVNNNDGVLFFRNDFRSSSSEIRRVTDSEGRTEYYAILPLNIRDKFDTLLIITNEVDPSTIDYIKVVGFQHVIFSGIGELKVARLEPSSYKLPLKTVYKHSTNITRKELDKYASEI